MNVSFSLRPWKIAGSIFIVFPWVGYGLFLALNRFEALPWYFDINQRETIRSGFLIAGWGGLMLCYIFLLGEIQSRQREKEVSR